MKKKTHIEIHAQHQYHHPDKLKDRQALWELGSNKTPLKEWIFDHFHFPVNANILELGAGMGTLWTQNASKIPSSCHLTISDFSAGMVKHLKLNLAPISDKFHSLDFMQINAQEIPFESNTFDVVIACHMLYHVPNLSRALQEIARVIKPEGKFYATTVYSDHITRLSFLREIAGLRTDLHSECFSSFLMDSGELKLRNFFYSVTSDSYFNEVVLSPENISILINYIKSSFDPPNLAVFQENYPRLLAQIQSIIQKEGSLKVLGKSGIFIASEKEIKKL